MPDHTPTPWELLSYATDGEHDGHLIVQQGTIAPAIVRCHHSQRLGGDVNEQLRQIWNDEDADWEFIVRAVNAHDELVAACEMLLPYFTERHSQFWQAAGVGPGEGMALHSKLCAALAKATP